MRDKIEYIAKYLAKDIVDTNSYDLKAIASRVKIVLGIVIGSEFEAIVNKELANQNNVQLLISERDAIVANYWEDVCKVFMPADMLVRRQDILKAYLKNKGLYDINVLNKKE